jgi:cell volume regulation protein A
MLVLGAYVTAAGVLLIASILLGRTTNRVGIPAFLAFLILGIIAGTAGLGRIASEHYRLTFDLGTLALSLILFDGGLNTPTDRLRQALAPAIVLATVGVALTAVLTGIGARFFGFSWTQALLLGAVLSSTDAAAVFLLTRSAGIQLRKRPSAILELESGLNDPMAFLMTAMLTQSLIEHRAEPVRAALAVMISLCLGAFIGAVIGWAGRRTLQHLRPGSGGLYPVFTLAVAFLSFGLPSLIEGSGLLAAYTSGIVLGAGRIPYAGAIRRVHDSMAWLAQLSMFLVLGLLVTPTELIKAALPGVAIALILTLVSRPLAVFVCLLPFRLPIREWSYIAAAGLRGAVPIILALLPLMDGAPESHAIFNIAFFGVLASALMPGAIVGKLAKWLSLAADAPPAPPAILEISSAEVLRGGEIAAFYIDASSAVAGALLTDLPLPAGCSVLLLIRGFSLIAPAPDTVITPADHVYVLCPPEERSFVSLIFGTREAD